MTRAHTHSIVILYAVFNEILIKISLIIEVASLKIQIDSLGVYWTKIDSQLNLSFYSYFHEKILLLFSARFCRLQKLVRNWFKPVLRWFLLRSSYSLVGQSANRRWWPIKIFMKMKNPVQRTFTNIESFHMLELVQKLIILGKIMLIKIFMQQFLDSV